MLHTKHLRQAFIAQKGFSSPIKDAMADVVIEIVESKKDEIAEKVIEQIEGKKEDIEKKVDEVADKAEETIEQVGEKIEEAAKPLTDLIDKLDDNPQIAKAIDMVDDIIGDQLDGREISCSCFGWLVALRISRKMKKTLPSKPEEIPKESKSEVSQHVEVKEVSLPTAPPS